MELGQNWTRFQEVFSVRGPKRRGLSQLKPDLKAQGKSQGKFQGKFQGKSQAKIILITDGAAVLWRFSECAQLTRELNSRDFLDQRGVTVVDLQKDYPDREVILLDRSEVESWMKVGAKLQHFVAYGECLKSLAERKFIQDKKLSKQEIKAVFKTEHFILEAIGSWWSKVFPSSFGVLICFSEVGSEGALYRDGTSLAGSRFLAIFRRGKLDSYDIPDLTGFIRDPATEREALIKFLSERYQVSVTGLFVSESKWVQWGLESNPWKNIAKSLREDTSQLVPLKMSLVATIAAKAFLKN